jgi:hypothetical protein
MGRVRKFVEHSERIVLKGDIGIFGMMMKAIGDWWK